MTIQLTVEQEACLAQIATETGRSVEDLVHEAIDLYIAAATHLNADATFRFAACS